MYEENLRAFFRLSFTGVWPAGAASVRLAVSPNPVHHEALLLLTLPQICTVRYTLHDQSGRMVTSGAAVLPEGRQYPAVAGKGSGKGYVHSAGAGRGIDSAGKAVETIGATKTLFTMRLSQT